MDYIVVRSNRKTVSLTVNDDLMPVVRAPYSISKAKLDEVVKSNEKWLNNAISQKKARLNKYDLTSEEIENLISSAKQIIPSKVEYYSMLMNVKPTGIKITRAKKRFGSCNGKKSLCFSCYLMLYPDDAIDYVVVHELAHIVHLNHSKDFYNLVEKYLPDYKQREKLLKQN
jgi:hypothetical protein